MKNLATHISVAIVLALTACNPKPPTPVVQPPPPPPPAVVSFDTVICSEPPVNDHCNHPIDRAQVSVDDKPPRFQTSNADGYNIWTVPASLVDTFITVNADGFDELKVGTVHPAHDLTGHHNFLVMKPSFVPLPALVPEGQHFRLANGGRFTAIEHSDFNLLGRFLSGEDIRPVLAQRSDAGFNMLRVWTRYKLASAGIGDSTLAMHPDMYQRIPDFLKLASRYGLRIEFTAYIGPGDQDVDPAHWSRLVAAVSGQTNVILELVNENDVHPQDLSFASAPTGVLASHGSNGSQTWPIQPYWSYATFHTNGAPEEQRKVGHNGMEIWPGATLTNETSRYPDVGMWVGQSLDRQMQLAFDSAAGAALLSAGSCFHTVHGKSSEMWDANELAVARAWVKGAQSVPLECQDGGYKHRADLETPDVLRAYQRGDDPRCVVVIHK